MPGIYIFKVRYTISYTGCTYTSYFTSMVILEVKVEQGSDLRVEWSLERGAEQSSNLEVEWNLEQRKCEMGCPLTSMAFNTSVCNKCNRLFQGKHFSAHGSC